MEIQKSMAASYRDQLEAISSSRFWRVTGPLHPQDIDALPLQPQPMPTDQFDHQRDLLRGSSLFDPEWYLETYPEAAESELEPAAHYLKNGALKGFDPSPQFSTIGYLLHHPDVRVSSLNPLVHYIEHGKAEGRMIVAKADA